jgi:hypothetical protein
MSDVAGTRLRSEGFNHPSKWAWTVECATCPWSQTSQDREWTRHAGVVHTEMLRVGHVLAIDAFGNSVQKWEILDG